MAFAKRTMKVSDFFIKRSFDLFCATIGLLCLWPVILVCIYLAARDTGASGIFPQIRIGKNACRFTVFKIRTMRAIAGTSVTAANDARITALGAKLRRYKLDELPQLWNVIKGDMSLVGPRPDVPGFADTLEGEGKSILSLRPGITGPATLKYRDEELLLANQEDPDAYNKNVIWPDKVNINLAYMREYSFSGDLKIIMQTVFGK